MPNYLTLAYEGNYVGRQGLYDLFTYEGKLYAALPLSDKDIVNELL